MKDTDLAWLAGIWDGEGTISLCVQNQDLRQPNRHEARLNPIVTMSNTDINIVNKARKIAEELECSFRINEQWKKGSTKLVYTMTTSNQDYIKKFLTAINPYLEGEKKAKGEILLDFVSRRLEKRASGLNTRAIPFTDEDWDDARKIRSSQTTREAPVAG